MDPNIYLTFCNNLFDKCGASKDALFFSLFPSLDSQIPHLDSLYFHTIENLPNVIDSAISVIENKRNNAIPKNSLTHQIIKDNFSQLNPIYTRFTNSMNLGLKPALSTDKVLISLAILSHIYLDTFERPGQFFLPYSSACSGQWDMWENVDCHNLRADLNSPDAYAVLNRAIGGKDVWDVQIEPEHFNEIIKRRLIKENAFGTLLSPLGLIKAIIIRMGEISHPKLNYEMLDFSIRKFLRYLKSDNFVRVDREVLFCRQLEENISSAFKKHSQNHHI